MHVHNTAPARAGVMALARRLSDRLGALASSVREAKASRAGRLIALETGHGQPVWSPRDYAGFARDGMMQNAIVYRSVRMIAEAAASVPLLAYEGDEEIETHPLLDLLRRPNPVATGTDLLGCFYGFLLVSGNAYVEAVGYGGMLRELHVLRPDRMKVVPGADGWPVAWEYSAGGETVRIAGDAADGVPRILHMKLFHPANDHYGLSPVEAAATAIDIHNAASKWNKALLDNSARPSGALVYGGGQHLPPEQFARLKEELSGAFQGARNAGRPMLLEGGLDWRAMSLSPRDMDFIEAKHAAAREIALAIGVPPMLLGIPGDNTYSNYAEANRAFWRQTVLPLVSRTASALARWLGPAWNGEITLRADLDQIEALSPEREALWARLERASFLTDDEKRAAVGYARRDDSAQCESGTFSRKFNPNQPRIPAGSSGGGRWTDSNDGGVAAPGNPFGSDVPASDTANPFGSDASVTPVQYNPDGWAPHDYTEGPSVVCPAELRCSRENMVDYLSRFAVPGREPSLPVRDGEVSVAVDPRNGLPGGLVRSRFGDGGLAVTNQTLWAHILHEGEIERRVTRSDDGAWSVTTRGRGNNWVWPMNRINEWHGPDIFREVDRRMREYIRSDRGGQVR